VKRSTRSANRKSLQPPFTVVLWAIFSVVAAPTAGSQRPQGLSLPATENADSNPPLATAKRLIATGHFKEAEGTLHVLLARDSLSADARYLLAYALLRQDHAKEALEQYTQAAALRTPTAGELTDVGKAYVLLEDYEDAGKWMLRSVAMNPDDPEAWYSLGRLRFTEQRFSDALECFKRALALAPGSVKVENNLGLAYDGLNRTDEAMTAYRQAIAWQEAGPAKDASEQPLMNLGIALEQQGQLSEARALLTRAAAIAPDEPRVHEHLGQISMQQGKYPDAEKELETATRLDPQKSNLHYLLGQTYRHLGRQEDAKAEFDTAARLGRTPPKP